MYSLKKLAVVSYFYCNNDSVHVSASYDPNLRFMITSLAMYQIPTMYKVNMGFITNSGYIQIN